MAYPIYVPSDFFDTGFFSSIAGSFEWITLHTTTRTTKKANKEEKIYMYYICIYKKRVKPSDNNVHYILY